MSTSPPPVPPPEEMRDMLRAMTLIRRFEERASEEYMAGRIGGFLHLAIGEEAAIVGTVSALRPDDPLTSTYREHGQALARGTDPRAIMAELLGRATGICGGRGGSMTPRLSSTRNVMISLAPVPTFNLRNLPPAQKTRVELSGVHAILG